MSAESRGTLKSKRLKSLSTEKGIIAALAMDQRKSLRRLMAEAAGLPTDQSVIGNSVSSRLRYRRCLPNMPVPSSWTRITVSKPLSIDRLVSGLLLAYELDGYENPRPNRMLALMPLVSVRRLMGMGADGIKILLHYAPEDPPEVNDEKCVLIERIGTECGALEMPFFFEPIVYEPTTNTATITPAELERQALEFAQRKPGLVIATMREFSRSQYHVGCAQG